MIHVSKLSDRDTTLPWIHRPKNVWVKRRPIVLFRNMFDFGDSSCRIVSLVKEAARLDRTLCPVMVEKNYLNKRHKRQRTCCNYEIFNEDTVIVYRR